MNDSTHIQTLSGRMVDPFNLKTDDIDLGDICHALSMTCRYGGHIKRFYSVAEHSYYVGYCLDAPPADRAYAFLHDAAEAYLGDIPRPLKGRLAVDDQAGDTLSFTHYEERALGVILKALGLPQPSAQVVELVHQIDMRMLATERRDLLIPTDNYWPCLDGVDPMPWRVEFPPHELAAPDSHAYTLFNTVTELIVEHLTEEPAAC